MNGQKGKRQSKKKTAKNHYRAVLCLLLVSAALLAVCIAFAIAAKLRGGQAGRGSQGQAGYECKVPRPELDVELLTVNEYSRPAIALEKVNGVVIHYTANPGTSAMANRNYFENLKDTHTTKASSHFIVGLEGEIVQCIPSREISYASNGRNVDTIAIECCIEDETGRFNQATYDAVVHLAAWLVEYFGLEVSDVIRHYDVTGKPCPKYFVDFPSAWEQFLADVQAYLQAYGVS